MDSVPADSEHMHKTAFMEAVKKKKQKEKQEDAPDTVARGARLSMSVLDAIVLDEKLTVENYDFRLIN